MITPKTIPPPPENSEPPPPAAWQPFTCKGIAAFAQAPYRRLLLGQAFVALIVATSAVWFLQHCYSPVITQLIQQLPDGATLTNGQLAGLPSVLISETKFLSIAVAADPEADLDQSADLQVAWHKDHLAISSLLSSALGDVEYKYDTAPVWDLSRSHLEPLWGAWKPVFLVGAGGSVAVLLILVWMALAWLYAPAAKLMAWLGDRPLPWLSAWKLAGAALLPGALLMAVGVVFYGCQMVDVFGLGWFESVHILVGLIYLLATPFFGLRPTSSPQAQNPFKG